MQWHAVALLRFGRLTPAVQAQKSSHRPQCGIRIVRSELAEKASARKAEVHEGASAKIDEHGGGRALDHHGRGAR
jgi:hypothetical protein